ncbi:MAG TPA: hypothetical protein VGF14_01970 [Alphaproteobacteria bacterium]
MTDVIRDESRKHYFLVEICLVILFLTFYGIGSPWAIYHDLFIPTDTYWYTVEVIAVIFGASLGMWIIRRKSPYTTSHFGRFTGIARFMMYAVTPFILYYIFILAFFGLAEIVTESFGSRTTAV